MQQNILLARNIDLSEFESKITFSEPKALENGGKTVYMYYDGKPIIIQTPQMLALFGLSKQSYENGQDKYSIPMSFKDKDSRPSLKAFFELMNKLDKKLIQSGLENSTSWFKKKITSDAVVEALYTPQIKFSKDKNTGEITDKYPPTFRLGIPFRDGDFKCSLFNDREPCKYTDLEFKGSKVTAIMQCTGIWLAGGKFGCSWKLLQLRVIQPSTIQGFAFQDVDEDQIAEDCSDDEELAEYSKQRAKTADDTDEEKECDQDRVDENQITNENEVKVEEEPKKETKKIVRKKSTK